MNYISNNTVTDCMKTLLFCLIKGGDNRSDINTFPTFILKFCVLHELFPFKTDKAPVSYKVPRK